VTEPERRRATRLVLEHVGDIHACCLTSRRKTSRHCGENDQRGRKGKHAHVDVDAHPVRQVEAERSVEHRDARARKRQPQDSTEDRDGQRLD